ncbi:MAG: PIN domain nuclease [Candidatus Omnitrophica bacterium]|nr:PIN domain nuclease [Candidatus Omnitrophota bacterium]
MSLYIVRVFFIIISTFVGYQLGSLLEGFGQYWLWVGAGLGLVIATAIISLEFAMQNVSVRGLSAAVFGLLFGLLLAKLIAGAFIIVPLGENISLTLQVVLTLIFCYLGMVVAMRGRDEFNLIIPYVKFSRQNQKDDIILLDTSVIIDGRIADICTTKFIEGRFVVPKFVLRELQQIADSQDPLKRNRGRRGLDILNKIRKSTDVDVKISDEDFPELQEVDAKLVKMAKVLSGKIFTNDFNLNKIAELQGITVLNVNELANALKPVVLPGELMEVKLIKEGKEYNQGVAYLDDGTMVVVDNGRRLIGQTMKVMVTSVLQTTAGRMVFAKIENNR